MSKWREPSRIAARLNPGTFGRRLKGLEFLELAPIRAREQRKRVGDPISKERTTRPSKRSGRCMSKRELEGVIAH